MICHSRNPGQPGERPPPTRSSGSRSPESQRGSTRARPSHRGHRDASAVRRAVPRMQNPGTSPSRLWTGTERRGAPWTSLDPTNHPGAFLPGQGLASCHPRPSAESQASIRRQAERQPSVPHAGVSRSRPARDGAWIAQRQPGQHPRDVRDQPTFPALACGPPDAHGATPGAPRRPPRDVDRVPDGDLG
jgi:hypothetical protein